MTNIALHLLAISLTNSFNSTLVTVTGMENGESGMEYLTTEINCDYCANVLCNSSLPFIVRSELSLNMRSYAHDFMLCTRCCMQQTFLALRCHLDLLQHTTYACVKIVYVSAYSVYYFFTNIMAAGRERGGGDISMEDISSGELKYWF